MIDNTAEMEFDRPVLPDSLWEGSEPNPLHEVNVCVTLLDTETGRTATSAKWNLWWWTEGNGSCDCNRGIPFDGDFDDSGCCVGANRYLVVACDRPLDFAYEELNRYYPPELVAKHKPATWPGATKREACRAG